MNTRLDTIKIMMYNGNMTLGQNTEILVTCTKNDKELQETLWNFCWGSKNRVELLGKELELKKPNYFTILKALRELKIERSL